MKQTNTCHQQLMFKATVRLRICILLFVENVSLEICWNYFTNEYDVSIYTIVVIHLHIFSNISSLSLKHTNLIRTCIVAYISKRNSPNILKIINYNHSYRSQAFSAHLEVFHFPHLLFYLLFCLVCLLKKIKLYIFSHKYELY